MRSEPTSAGGPSGPLLDRPWVWIGILTALVLAAKLPTLHLPYHWDELAWAGKARWLSEGSLVRALPGFRPAGALQGRPPALFLTLAVPWKMTGHSIAVAHLLIAGFSAVGVCFTYLLGRRLYDGRTGLLAALLLFLMPLYFAQSGMFLGDLPVAALGVMSVYFALTERYPAYLLGASYMVLVKESSIAVVVALLVYLAIVTPGRREKFERVLGYSPPLFVIGSFFVWQKIATGHFFITLGSTDLGIFAQGALSRNAREVSEWLFVHQQRFLISGLIALHLATRWRSRGREWWLFLAVCLFSGYSFSTLYFLPRYILPVLPFVCLAGAVSLQRLVRTPTRGVVAGSLLVVVFLSSLVNQPFRGHGEFDMTYVRVVAAHQGIARYLETRFPDARILTTFPHVAELRHPEAGYVDRPMDVVDYARRGEPGEADLLLVPAVPRSAGTEQLRAFARANGWRRILRLEREGVVSEVYGRANAPPIGPAVLGGVSSREEGLRLPHALGLGRGPRLPLGQALAQVAPGIGRPVRVE